MNSVTPKHNYPMNSFTLSQLLSLQHKTAQLVATLALIRSSSSLSISRSELSFLTAVSKTGVDVSINRDWDPTLLKSTLQYFLLLTHNAPTQPVMRTCLCEAEKLLLTYCSKLCCMCSVCRWSRICLNISLTTSLSGWTRLVQSGGTRMTTSCRFPVYLGPLWLSVCFAHPQSKTLAFQHRG